MASISAHSVMEDVINLSFEDDVALVSTDDVTTIPQPPPRKHDDVDSNGSSVARKKQVSWAVGPNGALSSEGAVVSVDDVIDEVITPRDKIEYKPNGKSPSDDVETSNVTMRIPEISGLWWNDANIDDGKEIKIPENDFERLQLKVRMFVDHLATRLIGIMLIFLDIILMIIDLSLGKKSDASQSFYDGMALTLSCIFMLDVFLRLFSYGFKEFFTNAWAVVDSIIVVVTFVVTIFYTVLDEYIEAVGADGLGRLVVLARLLRVVRVGRIVYSHRQMKKSSRKTVSQNKRRYQKDGFDLDLTYVTDHVIAMSFPSSGMQSLFRNPIGEVSRFFKTKHPGKYRIYNLCSERSYDANMFDGQVHRVLIDDHNVPTVHDLMEFIKDAKEFTSCDADHVIAIHCKGGKGRTGTIVCSWLIEDGMFINAKDALEYFGLRRTDMEVGQTFQGVETASQIRYVGYFERIKLEFGGVAPPERDLKIKKIVINSIAGVGRGNGSDLSMQIKVKGDEVIMCKFGEQYNCTVNHDAQQNNVTCNVIDCPTLRGDVKIRFTSTTKSLPRGYDDCAFYFWINTSFVDEGHVTLTRDQIDNPHKKKTWHIFQDDFAVQIHFDDESNC